MENHGTAAYMLEQYSETQRPIEAITSFKRRFTMYADVAMEATRVSNGWEVCIAGRDKSVGRVRDDGVPRLY